MRSVYLKHFLWFYNMNEGEKEIFILFIFTLTSSAMIVCALSFDRFMAILYPFRYNMIGKKYRANIMLGLVWISCAFLASLPLMGLGSISATCIYCQVLPIITVLYKLTVWTVVITVHVLTELQLY